MHHRGTGGRSRDATAAQPRPLLSGANLHECDVRYCWGDAAG